jgi:hypothetical protein
MSRLGACWVTHSAAGCGVTPSTWTRRLATSSTNSTCSRCRNTVSTVKKSTASTPLACAQRNCRQVSADRFGAGPAKDGPDGAGSDPEAQAASRAAVGSPDAAAPDLMTQHRQFDVLSEQGGRSTPTRPAAPSLAWPLASGWTLLSTPSTRYPAAVFPQLRGGVAGTGFEPVSAMPAILQVISASARQPRPIPPGPDDSLRRAQTVCRQLRPSLGVPPVPARPAWLGVGRREVGGKSRLPSDQSSPYFLPAFVSVRVVRRKGIT